MKDNFHCCEKVRCAPCLLGFIPSQILNVCAFVFTFLNIAVSLSAGTNALPPVTNSPLNTNIITLTSTNTPVAPVSTNGNSSSTSPLVLAPTGTTDYTKGAAIAVSLLALAYTYWKDRKTDKRMLKIEAEQEREKKDASIRRSKASAPFFTPSIDMLNMLYEMGDDGQLGVWHFGNANVLTAQRKELPRDVPKATPVVIILNMTGKGARRIKISGDVEGCELKQEPDVVDASGRVFLKYPYEPAQHGKCQRVIISFETEDGFDLTHTYETRHGYLEFRRIDPL